MKNHLRIPLYAIAILVGVITLAGKYRPAPGDGEEGKDSRAVSVASMEETLAGLRGRLAQRPETVVVLGDSSLLRHFLLRPEEALESLLEADASKARLDIEVLAYRGFGPVAYYLLADRLAELQPRGVVLVANLQAFTDRWFGNLKIKHPELAAFVQPRRILEAIGLPLDLAGISDSSLVAKPILRLLRADRLVLALQAYRDLFRERQDAALVRLWERQLRRGAGPAGALKAGREGRAKSSMPVRQPVAKMPARAQKAANWRFPRKRRDKGKRAAGWVKKQFQSFGFYPRRLTREHPSVKVFAAAVRRLAVDQGRIIVLLLPVHLQALRMTGEYDRREIGGAIDLIKKIAVDNGAIALDLTHILKEERYFQDAQTHFTPEGNRLVAREVLEGLSLILEERQNSTHSTLDGGELAETGQAGSSRRFLRREARN